MIVSSIPEDERSVTIQKIAANKAREDEFAIFEFGLKSDPQCLQLAVKLRRQFEEESKSAKSEAKRTEARQKARRLRVAIKHVIEDGVHLPPKGPRLIPGDAPPINVHTPPRARAEEGMKALREHRAYTEPGLASPGFDPSRRMFNETKFRQDLDEIDPKGPANQGQAAQGGTPKADNQTVEAHVQDHQMHVNQVLERQTAEKKRLQKVEDKLVMLDGVQKTVHADRSGRIGAPISEEGTEWEDIPEEGGTTQGSRTPARSLAPSSRPDSADASTGQVPPRRASSSFLRNKSAAFMKQASINMNQGRYKPDPEAVRQRKEREKMQKATGKSPAIEPVIASPTQRAEDAARAKKAAQDDQNDIYNAQARVRRTGPISRLRAVAAENLAKKRRAKNEAAAAAAAAGPSKQTAPGPSLAGTDDDRSSSVRAVAPAGSRLGLPGQRTPEPHYMDFSEIQPDPLQPGADSSRRGTAGPVFVGGGPANEPTYQIDARGRRVSEAQGESPRTAQAAASLAATLRAQGQTYLDSDEDSVGRAPSYSESQQLGREGLRSFRLDQTSMSSGGSQPGSARSGGSGRGSKRSAGSGRGSERSARSGPEYPRSVGSGSGSDRLAGTASGAAQFDPRFDRMSLPSASGEGSERSAGSARGPVRSRVSAQSSERSHGSGVGLAQGSVRSRESEGSGRSGGSLTGSGQGSVRLREPRPEWEQAGGSFPGSAPGSVSLGPGSVGSGGSVQGWQHTAGSEQGSATLGGSGPGSVQSQESGSYNSRVTHTGSQGSIESPGQSYQSDTTLNDSGRSSAGGVAAQSPPPAPFVETSPPPLRAAGRAQRQPGPREAAFRKMGGAMASRFLPRGRNARQQAPQNRAGPSSAAPQMPAPQSTAPVPKRGFIWARRKSVTEAPGGPSARSQPNESSGLPRISTDPPDPHEAQIPYRTPVPSNPALQPGFQDSAQDSGGSIPAAMATLPQGEGKSHPVGPSAASGLRVPVIAGRKARSIGSSPSSSTTKSSKKGAKSSSPSYTGSEVHGLITETPINQPGPRRQYSEGGRPSDSSGPWHDDPASRASSPGTPPSGRVLRQGPEDDLFTKPFISGKSLRNRYGTPSRVASPQSCRDPALQGPPAPQTASMSSSGAASSFEFQRETVAEERWTSERGWPGQLQSPFGGPFPSFEITREQARRQREGVEQTFNDHTWGFPTPPRRPDQDVNPADMFYPGQSSREQPAAAAAAVAAPRAASSSGSNGGSAQSTPRARTGAGVGAGKACRGPTPGDFPGASPGARAALAEWKKPMPRSDSSSAKGGSSAAGSTRTRSASSHGSDRRQDTGAPAKPPPHGIAQGVPAGSGTASRLRAPTVLPGLARTSAGSAGGSAGGSSAGSGSGSNGSNRRGPNEPADPPPPTRNWAEARRAASNQSTPADKKPELRSVSERRLRQRTPDNVPWSRGVDDPDPEGDGSPCVAKVKLRFQRQDQSPARFRPNEAWGISPPQSPAAGQSRNDSPRGSRHESTQGSSDEQHSSD